MKFAPLIPRRSRRAAAMRSRVYRPGATGSSVAKGRTLKETMAATREVMDPKFSSFAIYEHCLPFNVSRAFDEASGIDDPVIWTDKRDQEMWASLQGGG